MSNLATNPTGTEINSGSRLRKYTYLMPRRGSSYKQLFVLGRIFPWTLYGALVREQEPMTIEEIAADWEVPVEEVREAIEYYESNPPEMVEDFRREEALMDANGMNDPGYKYNPRPKVLTAEQQAAIRRS